MGGWTRLGIVLTLLWLIVITLIILFGVWPLLQEEEATRPAKLEPLTAGQWTMLYIASFGIMPPLFIWFLAAMAAFVVPWIRAGFEDIRQVGGSSE